MTQSNWMTMRAYAFLMLTAFAWGGNAVAGKIAVGHASPFLMNLLRWILALVAISAVSIPQIRRDMPEIRKHVVYLFIMGAVGFTSFNALLYTALHHTSAINAVIEQAGIPMVIFLGNFLLFRQRVAGGQIAGFLLTLAGVALTASNGDVFSLIALRLNFGDFLMMLAVLVYSAYTIGLKYKPDIHWKSMMAATAAGALLAALPLAAYEWTSGGGLVPDRTGWLVVLYIGLVPSLMSQILFVKGVEAIGANRAGLFVNLVPIFGMMLSLVLLGESLHFYHVISLVLVFGGIVASERARPVSPADPRQRA